MSPDQVMGRNVTVLADIYSYGILLFELMTGSKPLAGDSVERVFYMILNEPVDLSPLRNAGVPETIVELVEHCTQKDPTARPQNFTEVREHLERSLRSGRTA